MFTKIEQKKVFAEILRQIKNQLTEGTLKAGDRLPSERNLSLALEVSRSTVREAIRALELLGLIRCVQGDGNYLVSDPYKSLVEPLGLMYALSRGNAEQVQQLRGALEVQNAALAAERCDEASAQELRRLCKSLDEEKNELRRADLDRELHFYIAELSGNAMIASTLHAVSSLIETIAIDMRFSLINDPSAGGAIDMHHKGIVEAIAAHQPQRAASLMGEHMELILNYIRGV